MSNNLDQIKTMFFGWKVGQQIKIINPTKHSLSTTYDVLWYTTYFNYFNIGDKAVIIKIHSIYDIECNFNNQNNKHVYGSGVWHTEQAILQRVPHDK